MLLLDEPVAGMSQDERTATGELLQRVAPKRTIVVVEHDMDFMRRFATRVTVLHQGKVLSEGTVAEVQADPKVQEVYLGRTTDAVAAIRTRSPPRLQERRTDARAQRHQAGYGRTRCCTA